MPRGRSKNPLGSPAADLHSAVLDFIRRGQRAQAVVDAILAAEPERRRAARPKRRVWVQ